MAFIREYVENPFILSRKTGNLFRITAELDLIYFAFLHKSELFEQFYIIEVSDLVKLNHTFVVRRAEDGEI